ncbi:MAG: 50S ribosomal protein L22 [Acidobacteria bacterium]|nr:50S ribosomal protein L22 [Acidobacteriota bacterium]
MADAKHARASVKYVRMSASKARFVLDLIRDKHVDEARRVLQFTPRAAAREISKVLNAAVANAETTLRVPADSLFVSRAWADEGPTLKRFQPRALGRAYRIRKRTTHITLVVEPREGFGGSED